MKGTDPTPPQLRLRYSKIGQENLESAVKQLSEQGVGSADLVRFRVLADELRSPESGQIEPLTQAAMSIGAEVHWID